MLKGIYVYSFSQGEICHTDRSYKKNSYLVSISYLVSSPTIWDVEFAKEIAAVTEQPPRNGFEEMIQWTKEGILWEFPIDNEAGTCILTLIIYVCLSFLRIVVCCNTWTVLKHSVSD